MNKSGSDDINWIYQHDVRWFIANHIIFIHMDSIVQEKLTAKIITACKDMNLWMEIYIT